ncbi:TetR/AcrR family transcriptional regulator [Streptomyces sp. Da 82-17]|uniref:TetR/AcrR family transcriptional regulator n=1 Tax=Streptomyces sp. Da 82-17 TaxID=3377116 RepID=UPI0038D4D156
MPAKQQRGTATAERLLAAASQVFAASGRPGFTVHAVAEAADVSLGSLYHHFGSIDGLAAHLHARCLDRLDDTLRAALTPPPRTPRAGIHACVRAHLRFAADHRDLALFLHTSAYSACSGHPAAQADEVRALRAQRLTPVVDWLRPHIAAGRVAPLPTPILEMLILGPVEEAVRRTLSGAYDRDPDATARTLAERIWRALRPAD